MRVVFFGTAEFAVPSLAALVQDGFDVVAVVTQPDRPQGRGQQRAASPVKRAAAAVGLPVLQPRRVRSELFLAQLRELAPDALALAAFGQIISQPLLDLPRLAPVNVHGSLLPRYRGAAPIQRAIMAGESVTGVTTMWMDASLDTGDILLSETVPIDDEDTAGTLTPAMATVGARLLVETLERLDAGNCVRTQQDDALATLAPAIVPEDCEIRWHEPARTTRSRIRGVSPKPGAYTVFRGRRIKVWHAAKAEGSGAAGEILAISKEPPGVLVACGDRTALLLDDVQPENSRRMSAVDWANGTRLRPGERFDLPVDGVGGAVATEPD